MPGLWLFHQPPGRVAVTALPDFSFSSSNACAHCNGTGIALDHRQIGRERRADRLAAGLTLRAMAERTGYTASYLCDLELGRRNWNAGLLDLYGQHAAHATNGRVER